MAEYLIDFNRGNDSNPGTIAQPWKNLSKLASLTLNDGDTVWLANDSTWNLAATVLLGTVAGKRGAPVTIARRDTGGGSDAYPILSYQIPITAGEWTYDAPSNAWYKDMPVSPGIMAWIELGGTAMAQYQEAALPLVSIDRAWARSGNRLYLYAPASTNPTAYYGSVIVGPGDRGALIASNDGTYIVFDGLKFVRQGTGILAYSDSGATREIVVRNCVSYNTGPLVFANTNTGGDLRMTVEDCVGERTGAAFVHLQDVGGVGMGPYTIQRNRFRTCGLGFPQGAIYLQVRGAPGKVLYNDIADAKYGTPLQLNDGCCIYTEIGASQVLVAGNYLHDSICAMQDNSGRTTTWTGNIVENCWNAMKCTDESNNNATNHTFINNTIIGAGSPDPVPQYTNKPGGNGWWAYETTSPVMQLNIRNNLFKAHPQAIGIGPAIETPASAAGTIDNNWWSGFSDGAQSYTGGAPSPTPTNLSSRDPAQYLNEDGSLPALIPIGGIPMPNPLRNAGTYVQGVTLRNGRTQPGMTPIGAYQVGRY